MLRRITKTSTAHIAYVTPNASRYTLLATILGSSIAFIDLTVVNVALPSIQRDLGGGLAAQQWIVDAYLLTLGSLILVGGALADVFGEVRMFTLGVAAFGVASALCAAAPDATSLIAFRAVQGSPARCSRRPPWPCSRRPSPVPSVAPRSARGRPGAVSR